MCPTFRRIRRRFWSGSVSGTRFLFQFGWFLSIQPWQTRTAKKKNCFISWLSENISLMAFFTTRIQMMKEGNSFSLSTLVGGYRIPGLDGGDPVKDQDGGYPPIQDWMGYPPVQDWMGYPLSAKWALAIWQAVCLLRSCRRTFLYIVLFSYCSFVTAPILRMTGGNVFTLYTMVGGLPHPSWWGRGTPSFLTGGTSSFPWGVDHLSWWGYPPSFLTGGPQGTPHPGQVPGQDGWVLPWSGLDHPSWWWVPPSFLTWGTPGYPPIQVRING